MRIGFFSWCLALTLLWSRLESFWKTFLKFGKWNTLGKIYLTILHAKEKTKDFLQRFSKYVHFHSHLSEMLIYWFIISLKCRQINYKWTFFRSHFKCFYTIWLSMYVNYRSPECVILFYYSFFISITSFSLTRKKNI